MVLKKCCGVLTLRIAMRITILALLLASGVNGANLTVCPGGCEYSSIQKAINASSTGDTILVKSGTYFENVKINKKLILRGIGNPVVDAAGSGSAITLAADGITLEGFTAIGSSYPEAGINVTSRNNTLSSNNASNNWNSGISLSTSSNNTLRGNMMTGNYRNFNLDGDIDSDFENDIDKSNLVDGRPMYYIIKASDVTYDSSSNAGTFYCISCVNVTIKNLNLNKNGIGIFFWNTSQSRIKNVNASNNNIGIYLSSSSKNTLSGNIASSNNYGSGIVLSDSNNNTLSGNIASKNNKGIHLSSSKNNTLVGNNAPKNFIGISLESSSNNMLRGNNASKKNIYGISLYSSSNNNELIGNNASKNKDVGISLEFSSKNTLRDNMMTNFNLNGDKDSDFENYIDISNLADGRPIYFIIKVSDKIYDSSSNAGTFYCIGCVNVTIKNLKLNKNGKGIYFRNTSQSRIQNVTTSSYEGIWLHSSSNNTLIDNNASNNVIGIRLDSSSNNTLSNNNASKNLDSIVLSDSSNNTLTCNNVSNNWNSGISLESSNNNMLNGNNANSNNGYSGISVSHSSNNTLVGNNAINNWNGAGIHFSSSSNNIISYNNAGSNNGDGISLSDSSSNTLTGNNANSNKNYGSGIVLGSSNNNTLTKNNALNNARNGIVLFYSSNNSMSDNMMTGNQYNFDLNGGNYSNFDNRIDVSNLVDGRPIYYIIEASDTIYDSSSNAGAFYCISCVNVTIKNLNLKKNGKAIFFWNTSRSRIQNVNASNNGYGIALYSSSNNTVTGNNVSNNGNNHDGYGISLSSSNNNTLKGINASNNWNGISLEYSNNNALTNNIASNNGYGILLYNSNKNKLSSNYALNNDLGIHLWISSKNKIYNNIFINTNNLYLYEDSNSNVWNTTRRSGTNIIGGSFLSGNFWANPDGTGVSQTCLDEDVDGICDQSYILDAKNIDYLPLAKDKIPPKSVTKLKNVSYAPSYINWTWKDPKGIDFKKVMVFIDSKFMKNVSKGKMYFNATNFTANTMHTISTWTVDMNGNINKTWTNSSAWTAK